MIRRLRTPEDHNDQGLGVAPFPVFYTKYTEADFVDGGLTHFLQDGSPMAWFLFTSSDATDVLLLPTADKSSIWRLPVGMMWPSGTLDFRDVEMTLANAGTVSVEIWEF